MFEDQIHIKSMSTIKVESTAQARLNLTPSDLTLLFLEYIQTGLLFRKPGPVEEAAMLAKTGTTSLIHHLKTSLQRTLRFFPPLVGRLATTRSDDGSASCFFVEGGNKEGGALFIHATVRNLSVADILDSSTYIPRIVRSLFPFNGVRNYEGIARPLLAVQVTEMVDGLFIGCSINHLLVDETSFWHFLNSWAEISRGEMATDINPISKLPFLDRDRVNLDLVGSSSINIAGEHLMIKNDPDRAHQSRCTLKERVFRFDKQSITKLKERANQEMVESKGKISSLQALIALVWRSIIRCRLDINTSADQETTFQMPMGTRQRLNPLLPEEYFGNAVFPGNVTLEVGKIVENGLGWTAWQINRMVVANNEPDKVRDLYMSWIKKPSFSDFDDPPCNFFVLVNSPRFDVYGNDFGWGNSVVARSGEANSFDGRITIFMGLEEGSVEIEVCLTRETLSILAEDAEFMQYVEI